MKKKLAIISANADQIPLVKKAKEMGIETHCFAWDKEGYIDCKGIADYFHPISIFEKEQILEKCKELKIDGITSIVYDYAVPTVAYVAQNMGLTGNNYEDALVHVNKYKARERFFQKGVSSPHFAVARKKETPAMSGFKYPVIVKPTDCFASRGVMKANSEKELKEALERAQNFSFSDEAIIEEFVTGAEVSVDSISWKGKHYIFGIRDKVTSGAPYFVEMAHHEPSQLSMESIAKIENEARKALDALNIRYGACDTEIKITEDGEVYLIEVNARMGGDKSCELIGYTTGHDYLKIAVNVALGYWEEPVITHKYHTGVYFLSKECEWIKQIIENKDKYQEIAEAEITKEELFPLQSSADRSGYFIYKSDKKKIWSDY